MSPSPLPTPHTAPDADPQPHSPELAPNATPAADPTPADATSASDRSSGPTRVVSEEGEAAGKRGEEKTAGLVDDSTVAIVVQEQLDGAAETGHHDHHFSHRAPWLRAAVLGANDGLVSVSALMLGVAAGGAERHIIFLSGLSSLVAGALSMAVGEYVSVWSQRDAEEADLVRERREFLRTPAPHHGELDELTQIYISRGLPADLARRVAEHFHRTYEVDDLVKVHARDELGIDTDDLSNPWQATFMSLGSFAVGGIIPLLSGGFINDIHVMIAVLLVVTAIGLAFFGALGAKLGGAPMWKAALRVLVGGLIALGVTFGIGKAFGVTAG